jgi:DNA polymerase III alpha subunit (gram-positive type)
MFLTASDADKHAADVRKADLESQLDSMMDSLQTKVHRNNDIAKPKVEEKKKKYDLSFVESSDCESETYDKFGSEVSEKDSDLSDNKQFSEDEEDEEQQSKHARKYQKRTDYTKFDWLS